MKLLSLFFTAWLLGSCLVACGGSGKSSAGDTRVTVSHAAAAAGAPPSNESTATTSTSTSSEGFTQRYLKDSDVDMGGARTNSGYRDSDDALILAHYGRPVAASVTKAVTLVTRRYFEFAARDNSRRACALMAANFVSSIPVVYGESGASYLHGARTCQMVIARLFKYKHRELIDPFTVTNVLGKGKYSFAFLGSTKLPARFIALEREHGIWKINGVIAAPVV